jgi:ATP-GRASP peptide maturase of grasp-with-spasm system
MILIYSKEDFENTTESVIDWLDYYGRSWARVNGEDLLRADNVSVGLPAGTLRLNHQELTAADVTAIWYRRGGKYKFGLPKVPAKLHHELAGYLKLEAQILRDSFPDFFPRAAHLDHPARLEVNKIKVLQQAQAAGLRIPQTIITSSRADVQAFAERCGGLIAKSIHESADFHLDDAHYILNTQQVAPDELPERFFPTLFQEQLDKEYELRVFCLDGEVYAMAIFSQLDEMTRVDFRNYNVNRPNRVVPYCLPEAVAQPTLALLQTLGLTNGSVDIVRTKAGEYVFLEVNPTGQFGMVSLPCNYHLEQRMAQFLCRQADAQARAV